MNLYLRLLYVIVASVFKPGLLAGKATCELTLCTFPNDLDINLHVNNGRYLTLCDLSRIDLFMRTGLARLMLKHRWMPIIAEHTMTYRKPLGAFRRFKATMHLTHWDEKYFFMSHTFSIGDKIIAEGTSKGVVRARTGVVAPEDVLAAMRAAR